MPAWAESSGGELSLAAIAQTIAVKPKLMLVDETTLVVGPKMVCKVLDLIKGLTSASVTISAVARKLNVGREISDRVIFMLKGELVESARLTELFDTPEIGRARHFLEKVLNTTKWLSDDLLQDTAGMGDDNRNILDGQI